MCVLILLFKFFGVFFGCAFWRGDVASLCFQLSVMVVRLIFARQPTFPVMIIFDYNLAILEEQPSLYYVSNKICSPSSKLNLGRIRGNGDTDDPYSSILILWVHLFKESWRKVVLF
ncbi:uncharacterized protein LOC110890820 isoform X3 [Helianthus annuus]|uniref:uncharacterized protein LOC110890820 isoform X3 n=1 Tax=Helianthus annuus TaxID=4232 RepID=UPI00165324FC|nr:uncharacterized protein LOC110890820 isoform X3 [Helianthus annuus]